MTHIIVLSLLIVALMASPASAASQESEAWRQLAGSLEPAASIAVRLKDGKKIKGTFIQRTDESVILKPRTRIPVPARAIPFAQIESIERYKVGRSPGVKVLIGAGIGFGAIGLIALGVIATLE